MMKQKWSTKLQKRADLLARVADLLEEGYLFVDAIYLVLPHHLRQYEEVLIQIKQQLTKGGTVSEILQLIGFQRADLLPIAVAESTGQLQVAMRVLSDRLKQKEQRQHRLRMLLLYPIILFVLMISLLFLFRAFFLPNFEQFVTAQYELVGFSRVLPIIVSHLPFFIIYSCILLIFLIVCWKYLSHKLSIDQKRKMINRIPFVSAIFKKMKTAEFAEQFGSLLLSGFVMADALSLLQKQMNDPFIARFAQDLQLAVQNGESIHQAISRTEGFVSEFVVFVKHGEQTGHLAKELIVYGDYLHAVVEVILERWLAVVQPTLFSLLAICIIAAYLAMLLPTYRMIETL